MADKHPKCTGYVHKLQWALLITPVTVIQRVHRILTPEGWFTWWQLWNILKPVTCSNSVLWEIVTGICKHGRNVTNCRQTICLFECQGFLPHCCMWCPAAKGYQNTPTVVTERIVQRVTISLFLLSLYFIAFATFTWKVTWITCIMSV